MNKKMIMSCGALIVLMLLSGCGARTAFNQRNFLLEVPGDLPQQKTSKNIILDVKSFNIDRAFSAKNLVYRKSQSEFETDFYNQFLIRPDDMITAITRSWLSKSGLFKWVLEPGSYTDATHVLEGNITAMYGDFREVAMPKATISIRFFVIKLPAKEIVFGKTYEAQVKFEPQTAEALVEALDKCLINILTNLGNDLNGQL